MHRGEHGVSGWRELRGQSEVIAVILLIGMVFAGATAVVIAGSQALDQGRGDASATSAIQSMQSLDATIEGTAQGSSSQSAVEFSDRGGDVQLIEESPANPPEAGKISVTVDPPSGPDTNTEFWLGTVRYERDGQIVAYQGGGVWRKTGNGSVAVSPPGVDYRLSSKTGTLSFPIVSLSGSAAGSEFEVDEVTRRDLLSTLGLANPVTPGTRVTVEIRSEFYQAWSEQLVSEFGTKPVSVDPSTETVTLRLESPNPASAVTSAAHSDGPSSAITNDATTDSYVSPGYAAASANQNGDVLTTSSFEPTSDVEIRGDVHAEKGSAQITNDFTLTGQIRLGTDPSVGPTEVNSDPIFESVFSTKGDLHVTSGDGEFRGDTIVGGTSAHGNSYSLYLEAGNPVFKQDVFVTGNAKIQQEPTFEGDLYVKDGDITQMTNVPMIDGNVYVENGDAKIGEDYYGDVHITGDVIVDGDVDLGGADVEIDGDVIVSGTVDNGPTSASVGGSIQENSGGVVASRLAAKSFKSPLEPQVPDYSAATGMITNKQSQFSSTNDNGDAGVVGVSGTTLGPCSPVCTLPSGDYYLDEIDLGSGETLELDTSSGPVNVYVDQGINMDNDAEIEVDGTHRANVYVGKTGSNAFYMTNTAEVLTEPDDRVAPLFWVYLKPTAEAEFNSDAVFTGVFFGPGGAGQGAEIKVTNDVVTYGSLVGHVTEMSADARIHYDENLDSTAVYPGVSSSAAKINFVHINQQTATVDG